MGDDELRAVIETPAEIAGLRLEPGLSDLVLRDASGEAGALPMLSHAMLETWRRRSGRTLTVEGYRSAGGISGAIAQSAESVYARFSSDERAIARQLFERLTELGEGTEDTRRRASFAEVLPTGPEAASVQSVLDTLVDARLLTTYEEQVEVAHEVLIREWPRLRDWLDQDRDGLRLLRHLTESAQAWESLERDEGELYRGTRLTAVDQWVEASEPALNPLERAFLDASRALQAREEQEAAQRLRRLRGLLAGVGALLVASVVVGGVALLQWDRANDEAGHAEAAVVVAEDEATRASDEAERAEAATELADEARAEAEASARLNEQRALEFAFPPAMATDRALGFLLALEAFDRDDSASTQGNMLRAFVDDPRFLGYIYGTPTADIRGLALHPNRPEVVTVDGEGVIEVRNLETGRLVVPPIAGPDNFSQDEEVVAFSPDGSLLVVAASTVGEDGTPGPGDLMLLDSSSYEVVLRVERGGGSPAFSPDGQLLAAGRNTDVAVLDGGSGDLRASLATPPEWSEVLAVAFSPDGRTLVGAGRATSIGRTSSIVTWEVESWEQVSEVETELAVIKIVEFSPDGSTFAVGGSFVPLAGGGPGGHGFFVHDASTGERLSDALRHANNEVPTDLEFSPDGRIIAAASADGRVQLWDAESFALINDPIDPKTSSLQALEFVADGSRLVTVSIAQVISQWDTGVAGLISSRDGRVGPITRDGDTQVSFTRFDFANREWIRSDPLTGALTSEPQGLAGMSCGTIELNAGLVAMGYRALPPSCQLDLSVGCEDAFFGVWDVSTLELLATIPACNNNGLSFAESGISPDGRLIAVTTCEGLEVWDIDREQRYQEPIVGLGNPRFRGVRLGVREGRLLLAAVFTHGVGNDFDARAGATGLGVGRDSRAGIARHR